MTLQLLVHSWKALCHFCIRSDIIGDNNCILLCKCDRNETMIVFVSFGIILFWSQAQMKYCYDVGEFNSWCVSTVYAFGDLLKEHIILTFCEPLFDGVANYQIRDLTLIQKNKNKNGAKMEEKRCHIVTEKDLKLCDHGLSTPSLFWSCNCFPPCFGGYITCSLPMVMRMNQCV